MISKESIREVVTEQRKEMESIFEKEKIVKREVTEALPKFLAYPNILAILGVRRCGKSICAFQVF